MKRRTNRDRYRRFLKKGIIMINGTFLCVLMVPFCMLFVIIDIVWLLTDEIVKKLDGK